MDLDHRTCVHPANAMPRTFADIDQATSQILLAPLTYPYLTAVHLAPTWLLACLVLIACSGKIEAPPSAAAQPPAELRTGDVTIRATTLGTAQLSAAMAARYGIEGEADAVLLMVALRRGPVAQEISVTGEVNAEAADLLGNRQRIPLRAVREGDFIDYVGTARISMPDTLRFTITAKPQGAPTATLHFHRDFFAAGNGE